MDILLLLKDMAAIIYHRILSLFTRRPPRAAFGKPSSLIYYCLRALHATLNLRNFGTVALPALTLYPGFLKTLPIST